MPKMLDQDFDALNAREGLSFEGRPQMACSAPGAGEVPSEHGARPGARETRVISERTLTSP
jgi:hypothetical protein